MTHIHSISSLLHAWQKDARGNATIIVGLSIFTLMAATGTAVDMGRAQLVQSKLSSALDAAGLAAGSTANSQDITTQATKFFNANYPANYLGSTITSFVVTPDLDNNLITLSATADVDNTFMKVVGVNDMTVSASSEITRANKGMELVLVLDNTGSMAGTKLATLKTAATDLVNILYGDSTTIENVWIGLVPFSQAVNIGSSRTSWVTSDSFKYGTSSWSGCVDAREPSGRDSTDDPPSVAKFPRYYWVCDTNNKWYGTNSSRTNCSANSNGSITLKSGIGSDLGPNKNCPQALLSMTSSKSSIFSNIEAMEAVGNTHINLGLVWGWRMLSPRWRTLWGGEMDTNALPLDYNTALMNKVVVLMTDGDNTMSSNVRTAYWYPSSNKLGGSNGVTELNTRTSSICTSMKANNIIIYTIAFGTGVSSSVQTLMRECATKDAYYFYSPTTSTLQQAFHTIGDSLANLRISR